ncbi:uncharacterized protein LY89DRAFT_724347 [Mollisia scopiformis]|uniref:Uncharacterized protein n=1 Tax=Mollisia scopiformis TaxID=149040 RepID=A0A132BAB1_MOLSC|nr:uncharacterized protein LY89DRAFT_724347 [Mollisia scopiformis]KUJ09321.1 hypothetical protein LY89DRAFT_724347 [Mollisia scopiformis]
MAQPNPINQSSSLSSTGGTNEPLTTGSTYNNPSQPTTSTTSTTTSSTGTGTESTGSKLKGVLAGIHGAGEKIRGEFNSAVDEGFHEPGGVAKNRAVADAGEGEIATGQFTGETKNREGVVPGADYGRRL